MKNFLILLLALFLPLTSFAGNGSGNVSDVRQLGMVGGDGTTPGAAPISIPDITKVFALTCGSGSGNVTSGRYYRCNKMASMTTSQENYQVTSGKVAYCILTSALTNTGAAGQTNFGFGYGTAAVTQDSSTPPSGDKIFSSGSGGGVWATGGNFGHAGSMAIPIQFPASSFPYLMGASGGAFLNAILICQEL